MSENLQLLRGRTLSRLVDEIFSPFRILSPTQLCPLSLKRMETHQADRDPLDSFLSLLCCSKMISPRVLERRESGKNLSDSVTEQSDDSSVTQALSKSFFRCIPPPSFGGGRKGTLNIKNIYIRNRIKMKLIYIVGPQNAKKVGEQELSR